ncbi:hypothetical protein [Peribacillus sp. NPDC101480]|uniref:hypothetical protein n=1 Tax=Peribacillus sp. NPDC101480 TaxID=3390620 RepID=UPI003CFD30D3
MSRTAKRGQAKLTRSNVDTISKGEISYELFNIYTRSITHLSKGIHFISFPDEVNDTIRELMNTSKRTKFSTRTILT